MADVLATLEADPAPDRRRKDTKSAIRRLGRVLRRSLVDVPADPERLRPLLAKATPASVGMSKACWSRVRSLTHAALRDCGLDVMPGRDVIARSAAWCALGEALPTKTLRLGLSRFVNHCSREGVEPDQVCAQTFEEWRHALQTRNLKIDPTTAYRLTVTYWNRAVASTPTWPRTPISLQPHARFYSLEWRAFRSSFAADVEAFLSASAETDEFAEHYARSVRSSTVALRRRQLRQLASVCVASGVPVEQLTDLRVLVAHGKAVLKAEHARQGKLSVSLGAKAWLLCVIARHWVKDAQAADALREIARRLNVKQTGMTPRNRDLLRQFDLKENVRALLNLPDKVLRRAQASKSGSPAEALDVLLAIAVDLLTVAPMRIGNLTGLDMTRHFIAFGRGRAHNRHIHIPGEETKTGAPFEVILQPRTSRLIDVYLASFRKRVCPVASPYLFPNAEGGQRCTTSFARAICSFVERETGLKMHVHLFRHMAGKLHIELHPDGTETVRQIFQHRRSDTTLRYYLDQNIANAFSRYDETLAKHRESTFPRHVPRRGDVR